MTYQETIQLLTLLVALFAVIVGPVITLRVAKKQIETSKSVAVLQAKTNVLSKNRQDWINTLRIEIAGFITTSHMINPMLLASLNSNSNPLDMHQLLSQLVLHTSKVRLLINPNEPDHQVLIATMENVARHVFSFKGQPDELTDELARLAQNILKREWERVKSFS